MRLQEGRYFRCILVVPLHSHGESLDSPQHEEAIKWTGRRTDRILQELEARVESLRRREVWIGPHALRRLHRSVVHHQRPHYYIAMAVNVLRHRVHYDIGSELDRTLVEGRHERIVHTEQTLILMSHICNHPNVDEIHHWVRRRLDPNDLRARL